MKHEESSVGGRCYIYSPCPCSQLRQRNNPQRRARRERRYSRLGGVYEVEPDDTPDMALWNAGDDVLVCGDEEMINKDNGDRVHVTPAR
jgi:hypothetical protein